MKHVRRERDIYSLVRMLRTNACSTLRILEVLSQSNNLTKFFTVSTDKATKPSNFMGLSKLLMEDATFGKWPFAVSSARFANVAYSNGSLLDGFIRRLEVGQPLSFPSNILRYFVNHHESGHLCLISVAGLPSHHFLIPEFEETDALGFAPFAEKLICEKGFRPYYCDSQSRQ